VYRNWILLSSGRHERRTTALRAPVMEENGANEPQRKLVSILSSSEMTWHF